MREEEFLAKTWVRCGQRVMGRQVAPARKNPILGPDSGTIQTYR